MSKTPKTIQEVLEYLSNQGIVLEPSIVHLNTFFDPKNLLELDKVWGFAYTKMSEQQIKLPPTTYAMNLASMAAVYQLNAEDDQEILDTCAAPGMKSLYAQSLYPCTKIVANDISNDRLSRLKNIFNDNKYNVETSKCDARFLDKYYKGRSFERILIDAPCSGEGLIMRGDESQLASWSTAKVKRLQQLQIGILKSAFNLLAPGGRLVYSTCTLNLNENERVIKKALGIEVETKLIEISPNPSGPIILNHGQAIRIKPSKFSIGFFIAVIEKEK